MTSKNKQNVLSPVDVKFLDAAKKGDANECARLLTEGAVVDATVEDSFSKGFTALHFAARYGYVAVAELLATKGANIRCTCNIAWTPLHYAAYYGHLGVVSLLLEKGADIDSGSGKMDTPLCLAASGGRTAVVELLISSGANIHAYDDGRSTPLHDAAGHGNRAVVEILLTHGARVNEPSAVGTPLHRAAMGGSCTAIELLLAAGANIQATCRGDTPLHYAAEKGQAGAVRLLLSKGARIDAKNDIGFTPFTSATVSMPGERLSSGKEISAQLIKDFAEAASLNIQNRTLGETLYLSHALRFLPLLGPYMIRKFQHFCFYDHWTKLFRWEFPTLVPILNYLAYSEYGYKSRRHLKRCQILGGQMRQVLIGRRCSGLSIDQCEEMLYRVLKEAFPDVNEIPGSYRCYSSIAKNITSFPGKRMTGKEVLGLISENGLQKEALTDVLFFSGYGSSHRSSNPVLVPLERWILNWDILQLQELAEIENFLEPFFRTPEVKVNQEHRKSLLDKYPWFSDEALQTMEETLQTKVSV